MEEVLKKFFEEMNILIKELRIIEKTKIPEIKYSEKFTSDLEGKIYPDVLQGFIQDEVNQKSKKIKLLESVICMKTQKFIEEYRSSCINENKKLKSRVEIIENDINMLLKELKKNPMQKDMKLVEKIKEQYVQKSLIEKEIQDNQKELEAFNEFMGNFDFTNSDYIYTLQTFIGKKEEKSTSRMSDGKVYKDGKKVENATIGDAINIEIDTSDSKDEDKKIEYLNKLFDRFDEIEKGYKDCLSPTYLKVKKIIIADNNYEQAFNQLQSLKLEDIYMKIIKWFGKENTVVEQNMLNQINERKNQNKIVDYKRVENLKKLNNRFNEIEKEYKDCLSPLYLEVKRRILEDDRYEEALNELETLELEDIYMKIIKWVGKDNTIVEQNVLDKVRQRNKQLENKELQIQSKEKKLNIFEKIKKYAQKIQGWFSARKKENGEDKILKINNSKKDEQTAYFDTLKSDVKTNIIDYPNNGKESNKSEEKEII